MASKNKDLFPWLTDKGKAAMIGGVVNTKKLTPYVSQQEQQRVNAEKIAADAQRAEQQRIARLNGLYSTAVGQVDKAFAPYDQNFFTNLQSQYLTPYMAELGKQREQADRGMLFMLVRQGIGDSSVAGNLRDRISGIYNDESSRLQKEASDFVDRQRGDIGSQKSIALRLADNARNYESMLTSLIKSPVAVTPPMTPKSEVTLADVFAQKLSTTTGAQQVGGRYGGGSYGAALGGGDGGSTSGPIPFFGGVASSTFRSPVRGEGKSFFAR